MRYILDYSGWRRIYEQGGARGWRLGLKFWPGAKGIGSGGFTFRTRKGKRRHFGIQLRQGGSQIVDEKGYAGRIQTDPIDENLSGWFEFLKGDGVMTRLMSPTSKTNWESLKADPEHIGYAVYSLEQFNESNPQYKWQHVFCDTEEGIRQEMQTITKEPDANPEVSNFNAVALPIEFPVNGPSSNFFEDNKWAPTAEFEAKLMEEVINPLREIAAGMQNIPAGEPKFWLEELEILTSCSRFRNTGEAATLTWKQLSQNRNNAAKDFVLKKLAEVGVQVSKETVITQDVDGENGDGSSGPNPPTGVNYSSDGKNVIKGETDRKDFGELLTNKASYDDYKYCIAGMTIVANTKYNKPDDDADGDKGEPESDVIIIDVPTKEYGVSFYSKPRYLGFSFRLPKIYADWERRVKRKRRHRSKKQRNFRTLDCPIW